MAERQVQICHLLVILLLALQCSASLNRTRIVRRFNPTREHGNYDTPLQVGNGNFAFGADVTGLQTIKPFNTLSSWGWHSSRPPVGLKAISTSTIRRTLDGGIELLDYAWLQGQALLKAVIPIEQTNPTPSPLQVHSQETLDAWQARNPHRINLARIGLQYFDREIALSQLSAINQTLELQTGILKSSFTIANQSVEIDTVASPLFDAVAFNIRSTVLMEGGLQVFIDFPFPNEHKKFEAPYMGDYERESFGKHKTEMKGSGQNVEIRHNIGEDTTYFARMRWGAGRAIPDFKRKSPDSHRYFINSSDILELTVSVRFSPQPESLAPTFDDIRADSAWFWKQYWNSGAFVDCSNTKDPRANELQRRTFLSQYLMAINAAGTDPPQESGLVNNGWYGKFHLESVLWHLAHWQRWGRWERVGTVVPWIYKRLLNGSAARRRDRKEQEDLNKWDDPTGKFIDAANEGRNGMTWEQPHPFYFAEQEWLSFPDNHTLAKWKDILDETARAFASSAKRDERTGKYDLMVPIEGGMNIRSAKNPTFDLAFWRFGLRVASDWYKRQNLAVPERIAHVERNLAQYPVANNNYVSAEHVTTLTPSISGIFGLLPPDRSLNFTIFQNTLWSLFRNYSSSSPISPDQQLYGTDFPTLAMTAIRMGDSSRAIDLLLDPLFKFDDAGYPIGKSLREEQGGRDDAGVPQTPYFPSSGGLLMTVAMLANGYKDMEGKKWPNGWNCEAEGFGMGV